MKGNHRKVSRTRRIVGAAAIVLAAIGVSTAARAEYVLGESPFSGGAPLQSLLNGPMGSSFNNSQIVWGASLSVTGMQTASAGTVSIKLADIGWTETLQSLSLLVTDLNGIWQRLDGPGSLNIDVSGPTQLFAGVFARSAAGQIGFYTLHSTFTAVAPVPLPAAAWLLISGLAGLSATRRKNTATASNA